MYALGGFGWVDAMVAGWVNDPILQSLIFFGLIFVVNDIISMLLIISIQMKRLSLIMSLNFQLF
jgi:hypothetical protein